jgi:hypothetical protein
VLADAQIATTLPNIYGLDQITEFAGAADVADLTEEELAAVAELYADNFGVSPLADQTTKVNA